MKKRKPNIEIGHYRGSRYWGVWVDSELLAYSGERDRSFRGS